MSGKSKTTIPLWPEGCYRPEECRSSGLCEYDRCPHGAALVIPAQEEPRTTEAWGWNGDVCAVWGRAIVLGETRAEKEARATIIATLSDPTALKVLWAAMCAMTQDIHSPQDNLSPEEWDAADRVFAQLDGVQNAEV